MLRKTDDLVVKSTGNVAGVVSPDKIDNTINTQNTNSKESTSVLTNSIILKKLTNSNWNRLSAKLEDEYEKIENKYVYDKYTLTCNSVDVINVIFNEKYKDKVISDIKVGDSFNRIRDLLGKPTYSTTQMIGYKLKKMYVFFYEDEISIYPIKNVKNQDFEELLFNYIDGNEDRIRFIAKIRENFTDFIVSEQDNLVIMKSYERQIEIRIDETGNIQVILYDGYSKGNLMKSRSDDEHIQKTALDLAEIIENERKEAE